LIRFAWERAGQEGFRTASKTVSVKGNVVEAERIDGIMKSDRTKGNSKSRDRTSTAHE